MKKYFKSEGYTTKDLIHYGMDHLASGLKLFEYEPRTYDSAGYLCHIGVELLLKAIMLHDRDCFNNEHCYKEILTKVNMPKSFLEISEGNKGIFDLLDQFSELRYPNPSQPTEIGLEDAINIKALYEEIVNNYPDDLKKEHDEIDRNNKGGRVLMKKKMNKMDEGSHFEGGEENEG